MIVKPTGPGSPFLEDRVIHAPAVEQGSSLPARAPVVGPEEEQPLACSDEPQYAHGFELNVFLGPNAEEMARWAAGQFDERDLESV
jgi:hypothetical protein